MKIVLNINIRSVLIFDRNLVGGDEVVRSSSFLTCRHDGGRGCCSAVLRGDHHCDVVWWSRWSELGGAARDVVDVVHGRCGRSSAEPLEMWSTWSVVKARRSCLRCGRHGSWSTWLELGGAARDVVDVVRGRRGRSSAVSIRMHACALIDSYLYSCMHADPYKHMQATYLDYFNQLRMASVDHTLDFLVC